MAANSDRAASRSSTISWAITSGGRRSSLPSRLGNWESWLQTAAQPALATEEAKRDRTEQRILEWNPSEIDRNPARPKLASELHPPSACSIHLSVEHARIVGWQDDALPIESAHPLPAERTQEVAEFQDNVLASASFEKSAFGHHRIVWGEKDYGKCGVGRVPLELLNDSLTLIRLLMQNNNLEISDTFKQACSVTLEAIIVAMNKENRITYVDSEGLCLCCR